MGRLALAVQPDSALARLVAHLEFPPLVGKSLEKYKVPPLPTDTRRRVRGKTAFAHGAALAQAQRRPEVAASRHAEALAVFDVRGHGYLECGDEHMLATICKRAVSPKRFGEVCRINVLLKCLKGRRAFLRQHLPLHTVLAAEANFIWRIVEARRRTGCLLVVGTPQEDCDAMLSVALAVNQFPEDRARVALRNLQALSLREFDNRVLRFGAM